MRHASQKRRFVAEVWNRTPTDIWEAINLAQKGVAKLQKIGDALGIKRKFTLDGRLVGDIGELIVARYFKIENAKPKGHAHDLCAKINGKEVGVQVKLRCQARGKVGFKYRPQVLIVLEFTEEWSKWRIVFHGSGKVIRGKDITVGADHRLMKEGRATIAWLSLKAFEHQQHSGRFSQLVLKPRRHT